MYLFNSNKIFFIYHSIGFVYMNWYYTQLKQFNLFKVFYLFNVFYKKQTRLIFKKLKKTVKPFSNHRITCNYYAGCIKIYKVLATNVLLHSKKYKINISNILLPKKTVYTMYKMRYLNLLKFKNVFLLFLYLIPLYLLNLYESWSIVINYRYSFNHDLHILIPFKSENYFQPYYI